MFRDKKSFFVVTFEEAHIEKPHQGKEKNYFLTEGYRAQTGDEVVLRAV